MFGIRSNEGVVMWAVEGQFVVGFQVSSMWFGFFPDFSDRV